MPLFGRPTPQDDLKAQAYAQWIAQRNPLAIISLILGIFSLVDFGVLWLPEIAGIALGIIALNQLSKTNPNIPASKPLGHRLAWTGILLSAASLILALCLYLTQSKPRNPKSQVQMFDQVQMTNTPSVRISSFVIQSSFRFRHSDFPSLHHRGRP